MIRRCCPVPRCIDEVPSGENVVFCVEHHFALPYRTTSQIFELQLACTRATDDDVKAHLNEQIAAHVSTAVRSLTGCVHAA